MATLPLGTNLASLGLQSAKALEFSVNFHYPTRMLVELVLRVQQVGLWLGAYLHQTEAPAQVFIFSAILMSYMFRDFRKFSRYRAFIRSFEIPSNYSVLVSGFPKGMRGVGDPKTADRQLGDYFRTFFEEKVKYGTVSGVLWLIFYLILLPSPQYTSLS